MEMTALFLAVASAFFFVLDRNLRRARTSMTSGTTRG
jgi:hypothetical protein